MKLPWNRKPAGKPKLVGMSKGVVKSVVTKKPQDQPAKPQVAKGKGFSALVQPYMAIIREDIKRLLKMDDRSRKNRETHNDFMEQHFGRNR